MDRYYQEFRIQVHTEEMGEDLCVNIYGGDRAHIGSVAIAEPRLSLTGNGSVSATVSTYNCAGHKDGEVANAVAAALASRLNRRTVAVCGMHYDAASAELLLAVLTLAGRITDDITAQICAEQNKE